MLDTCCKHVSRLGEGAEKAMDSTLAVMTRLALAPVWLVGLTAYVMLQLVALLIAMPMIIAIAVGNGV
ncbi:MAG: hypothetical protein E6J45_07645 [Chloroflexi bacterium]|nr:MAG: hypothetical protein E6J45_07645 [Chloroflexota bacterium]